VGDCGISHHSGADHSIRFQPGVEVCRQTFEIIKSTILEEKQEE
jgi:hypothetical protein